MATQNQIADQMLAQLRILDPSVSAELGTPERKIIDTVAQALSDAQIDLSVLAGALDVDAKVGTNLDNFLSLFGFGRQSSVRATGFVTFSRTTPSVTDINIPSNTQIFAANPNPENTAGSVFFVTEGNTTLPAGETEATAAVHAVIPGGGGNVASNTITQFAGSPVFGITAVTNPLPTTGGLSSESDDELKIRFRETVFRNLAGTADQILALAVATKFTTKVNVVGPVSRYREYIQVPDVDDTVSENVNPSPDITLESPGPGSPGSYTTALSTVPYSQHTYDTVPAFISNGQTGVDTLFYREGIDWQLNTTAADKTHGDAERFYHGSLGGAINPASADAANMPSVTFLQVYQGSDPDVQLVTPGQVVLFEHSYMSNASRNNYERNITNAVDVFIDGGNIVQASTVVPAPGVAPASTFNNTATSSRYRLNYRRNSVADVSAAPVAGHLFIPLFWQPVVSIPDSITITGTVAGNATTVTFYRDENYWFVEDITNDLRGTVRARNGIEWDITSVSTTSGSVSLDDFALDTVIKVEDYGYDQNVIDIQSALESAKQVTTDVLVHRSKIRYFKLDVTVMYSGGFNPTAVNLDIHDAVSSFLDGLYYGSAIQLSDLLQVIHNVVGVDNVRWSSDLPGSDDLARVTETDYVGSSGGTDISHDFFLRDDELASLPTVADTDDTVPGLRIRPRAQNTWIRA